MANAFFRLPVTVPSAKYKINESNIVDVSKAYAKIDSNLYFDFSLGDTTTRDGMAFTVTNGNLPMTFRNGGLVLASKAIGGYGFPTIAESDFTNGYTLVSSVKIPKDTKAVNGVAILLNFFGGDSFSTANYSSYAWHLNNIGILCYGKSTKADGTVLANGTLLSKTFKTYGSVDKFFLNDVYVTTALCNDPNSKQIRCGIITSEDKEISTAILNTESKNVLSNTLKLNIGSSFFTSGANSDGALDYIMTESFLLKTALSLEEMKVLIKERYIKSFG